MIAAWFLCAGTPYSFQETSGGESLCGWLFYKYRKHSLAWTLWCRTSYAENFNLAAVDHGKKYHLAAGTR